MTGAVNDCRSEHGKNYLDSRLMSDIGDFATAIESDVGE
jgi:hypothetical protein